jgi:hypothetical protein
MVACPGRPRRTCVTCECAAIYFGLGAAVRDDIHLAAPLDFAGMQYSTLFAEAGE